MPEINYATNIVHLYLTILAHVAANYTLNHLHAFLHSGSLPMGLPVYWGVGVRQGDHVV